jgi:hypothetical protein
LQLSSSELSDLENYDWGTLIDAQVFAGRFAHARRVATKSLLSDGIVELRSTRGVLTPATSAVCPSYTPSVTTCTQYVKDVASALAAAQAVDFHQPSSLPKTCVDAGMVDGGTELTLNCAAGGDIVSLVDACRANALDDACMQILPPPDAGTDAGEGFDAGPPFDAGIDTGLPGFDAGPPINAYCTQNGQENSCPVCCDCYLTTADTTALGNPLPNTPSSFQCPAQPANTCCLWPGTPGGDDANCDCDYVSANEMCPNGYTQVPSCGPAILRQMQK